MELQYSTSHYFQSKNNILPVDSLVPLEVPPLFPLFPKFSDSPEFAGFSDSLCGLCEGRFTVLFEFPDAVIRENNTSIQSNALNKDGAEYIKI